MSRVFAREAAQQGRRGRLPLGRRRAGPGSPVARLARRPPGRRRSAPPRPACSPTWTPSPTCSTAAPLPDPPPDRLDRPHRPRPADPTDSDMTMTHHDSHPVAVVGMSAIMPDAPDGDAFWHNITGGRYSHLADVPPERWDPDALLRPGPQRPGQDLQPRSAAGCASSPGSPIAWRLPVPPKVAAQMDEGQQWAISAARAALTDAGWPDWPVDPERVAVILGNALGGEKHYQTSMRIQFPELLPATSSSRPRSPRSPPETRERDHRGVADAATSPTCFAHHRGHHARRARERHRRPGREPVQPPRDRTSPPTPPAPPAWPR